jgi:hypothetical protein
MTTTGLAQARALCVRRPVANTLVAIPGGIGREKRICKFRKLKKRKTTLTCSLR